MVTRNANNVSVLSLWLVAPWKGPEWYAKMGSVSARGTYAWCLQSAISKQRVPAARGVPAFEGFVEIRSKRVKLSIAGQVFIDAAIRREKPRDPSPTEDVDTSNPHFVTLCNKSDTQCHYPSAGARAYMGCQGSGSHGIDPGFYRM